VAQVRSRRESAGQRARRDGLDRHFHAPPRPPPHLSTTEASVK
jgi:hypothetical protein